jgi:hypothetical protein
LSERPSAVDARPCRHVDDIAVHPREEVGAVGVEPFAELGRGVELCGVVKHAEVVETDERQRGDRWPAEQRLTRMVGDAHVGRVVRLTRHGSHRQR